MAMQLTIDALQIDLRTTNCTLPEDERTRMQPWLNALAEQVQDIPNPTMELHIAHHARSDVFNVELRLKLPGRSLFVREKNPDLDTALERGLTKLQRKLESYWRHPDEDALTDARRRAAVERTLVALPDPDVGPLADAILADDYSTFRDRISGYDVWLNHRVGRWVQRDPEAQARLGDVFVIGDIVEEVYLNAFDRFLQRSRDVRLSEWLDSLIEPSLRALMDDPGEREAVSYTRSFKSPAPET
jgi:ribosome-associated translation inhibitor RaiA